ncbi:MAG: alpha/beta hydrolase [Nitratireductor sp.]
MAEAGIARGGEHVYSGTEEAMAYDRAARALSDRSKLKPVAVLGYGKDPAQKTEIYRPHAVEPTEPLPVLGFLHGGAWIAGGFQWLRFMAEAVVAQPAIFAAVTYRLAPNHKWPSQLEDGIGALRLIQARISDYGGDPDRIVLGGHSAGGQIAAMTVLSRQAAPVHACMPVSAPMDLRYGGVASDTGKGRVYRFLFRAAQDDAGASPICALAGNRTPFHLMWGACDFDHIRDSSARMCDALRDAGQPVTSTIEPGAGHFDTHLRLNSPNDDWYRAFRGLAGRPGRSVGACA